MNFKRKQGTRGGAQTMFSSIRKRMTYANVVATFALVFAMSGGAYAASKFLITSTKQIKPSVLASLKGKAGAKGAAGATGAAGAAGPQGPAGANGKDGAPGAGGANGENGKSVVLGSAGSHCASGGSSVEVVGAGSPQYVCNGKNGQTGFTETLPPGKTETGTLAFGPLAGAAAVALVPVSFPIPLAKALGATAVHYMVKPGMEELLKANEEEFEEKETTKCPGSVEAPTAEKGNFCFYVGNDTHAVLGPELAGISTPAQAEVRGAGTAGAVIEFGTEPNNFAHGTGTWAVTGE